MSLHAPTGQKCWWEVSHPPSHSKQDCSQHQIGSAMALPQQVLKTFRGGDPTTSLGVCSIHVLPILFLGTYLSTKELYSTSRTITPRYIAIFPIPCPSNREPQHLLWKLGTLSLLFRSIKAPAGCPSSSQAGDTSSISSKFFRPLEFCSWDAQEQVATSLKLKSTSHS